MPDFTDGFSADMTEEARKYAESGPAQIYSEDWDAHLHYCDPAKNIRETIDSMADDAARTGYAEHLIRDAARRAVGNLRSAGTSSVKRFFLAETKMPGLWRPDTFDFIGHGVVNVTDGDREYDVPLRHLRIRTAAGLMAATAKDKLGTWGRIARTSGHLLSLSRDELPPDMTLASPSTRELYEQLRNI